MGKTNAASTAGEQVRLHFIDFLRFGCAAVVMFVHFSWGGYFYQLMPFYSPGTVVFAKYGFLSAHLFFLISGYVIPFTAQGSSAANFAWKRWLRVYPTFAFCVLTTAAACAVAENPHFPVSIKQVLANLLIHVSLLRESYLDIVYWTVVKEIWFYTFVFVALSIKSLRRNPRCLAAMWLILAAFDQEVLHGRLPEFLQTEWAALFCTGFLLFRLNSGDRSLVSVLLLCCSAVEAIVIAVQHGYARFAQFGVSYSPPIVVALLLLGILAVGLAHKIQAPRYLWPTLTFLGGVTYPLYLLHADIGFLIIDASYRRLGPGLSVAVAVAAVFLLSALVYKYVEPRLKSMIRRLVQPRRHSMILLNVADTVVPGAAKDRARKMS